METQASAALLSDPMLVFAYLGGLLAIIFWISGFPALEKFFTVVPPLIFAYFVPTVSTALGITPIASPAYDWIIRFLLPVALFLLVITIDLPALAKMGWMALVMMLAGTVGIIIGGPVAFLAVGHWLPDQAWTGLAALSGSWIGGAANMMAIAQSVGTPDSILGPIIVVDTAVGYGWMGVLLFLSAFQHRFDRWSGANTTAIEETNAHLSELQSHRHPIEVRDLAITLGLAFAAAVAAVYAGQRMPDLGDPTIISKTTWAVLFVVTGALALSLTPVRKLEEAGASKLGFMALYFLIAAIGARADLHAVLQTPMYLVAGHDLDGRAHCRPVRSRAPGARPALLHRHRQHGQHRRRGQRPDRGRRLPSGPRPSGRVDGRLGLHPRHLRRPWLRLDPRAAGRLAGLPRAPAAPTIRSERTSTEPGSRP